MPKKILLLAGDFVETLEAYVPFQALSMAGLAVHAVCPGKKTGDPCATAVHDFEGFQTYTEKRGHAFPVNFDFDKVDAASYDGLYIPGGRAPEYLRQNEQVLTIVRHFFDKKKPVGMICHGVQILTAAGVCAGRTMTCYPACAPELRSAGGTWIPNNATFSNAHVDGNLVSGPAWPAHPELLSAFLKLLGVKIALA